MSKRSEEEQNELEEKVEFIKNMRSEHHSAYKQSLMELLNYVTRENIDYEYESALRLAIARAEQSGLISKQ